MQKLESLGYSPETSQYYGRADHLPTLIRKTDWVWRGNFFDPDMPLSLELHFCLWNKDTSYFDVEGVQKFWERRVTRQIEDLSFSGLAEFDNLGYTALHVLRNILAGGWVVHHMYELARFLHTRAGDEEFWQSWAELHDDSLRSLEAISILPRCFVVRLRNIASGAGGVRQASRRDSKLAHKILLVSLGDNVRF